MKSTKQRSLNWQDYAPKEAALHYIEHVYNVYCNDYGKESKLYEIKYNLLVFGTIVLGFSSSIAGGLINSKLIPNQIILNWLVIILPALSSILIAFTSQYRIKEKFKIRETARIKANYYYTIARNKFAVAKIDEDYNFIHNWLAEKIYHIQNDQLTGFFGGEGSLKE